MTPAAVQRLRAADTAVATSCHAMTHRDKVFGGYTLGANLHIHGACDPETTTRRYVRH